jgi:hypothetical protein
LAVLFFEPCFGTAVNSDVTSWQTVLDELQLNKINIVHSVSNQVTYIKKLDTMTSTNVQGITNLSNIVNPFQSNFSATRILSSSYSFWAGKRLVDYLKLSYSFKREKQKRAIPLLSLRTFVACKRGETYVEIN